MPSKYVPRPRKELPPLTPEQAALIGDAEMGYARSVAGQFAKQYPEACPNEFESAAVFGLTYAARGFDESRLTREERESEQLRLRAWRLFCLYVASNQCKSALRVQRRHQCRTGRRLHSSMSVPRRPDPIEFPARVNDYLTPGEAMAVWERMNDQPKTKANRMSFARAAKVLRSLGRQKVAELLGVVK